MNPRSRVAPVRPVHHDGHECVVLQSLVSCRRDAITIDRWGGVPARHRQPPRHARQLLVKRGV